MKSPFWSSFFDHFGDCGKNGALFVLFFLFLALVGLGLPFVLTQLERDSELGWTVTIFMILLGGVFLALFLSLYSRTKSPERLGRMPPLQRADIRAVRAKLLKSRPLTPHERRLRAAASQNRGTIDL